MDSAYLSTLSGELELVWSTTLKLDVQLKIDTGAEVTAIREETYQALKGICLKESTKMLYGPSHQPLTVLGQNLCLSEATE